MLDKEQILASIDPKYLDPNFYDPDWDRVLEEYHALSEEELRAKLRPYRAKPSKMGTSAVSKLPQKIAAAV